MYFYSFVTEYSLHCSFHCHFVFKPTAKEKVFVVLRKSMENRPRIRISAKGKTAKEQGNLYLGLMAKGHGTK